MPVIDINKNLIDWFTDEMEASGISKDRVDHAGITVWPGGRECQYSGFRIPYYDQFGDVVPKYARYRLRDRDPNSNKDHYDSPFGWRKYWQAKHLPQMLYWPRVLGVDHSANLSNLSAPLFIIEGERKALKLQIELISLGIQASVVGVPGVRLGDPLVKTLKSIPYAAETRGERISRTVFIGFDFNDVGEAEEVTRRMDNSLRSALRVSGADVVLLRWALPLQAMGVQKIDDWLVAGGDLPSALEHSLTTKDSTEGEQYRHLLQINQDYAMLNGEFVRISGPNRGTVLKTTQFHNELGHLYTESFVGKRVIRSYSSRAWVEWADKRTMSGFCFAPPPLGTPAAEWVDGLMNVASSWVDVSPSTLAPWEEGESLPTHLIDTLLSNFCESPQHLTWLRQHIAHMLRHPDLPTSQVVLLCGKPGTGKTLLLDSFRRLASVDLLGGLAKSVRFDRKDDFNGSLEGTVVAIYEEPLKKSGKDIESLIKNLTGAKTIEIRKMRTDPYQTPNYVHLFVSMNLRYLSHIGRDDRRCNFFEGKEKIGLEGTGFGKVYDEFMGSELFPPTWMRWVEEVDLSGYSPQQLGPVSLARLQAIGFSSTQEEDFFSDEEVLSVQVRDCPQFHALWSRQGYKPISDHMMGRLAGANGWSSPRVIRVDGTTVKVRGYGEEWEGRPHADWVAEYKRGKVVKY